MMIDVVVAPSLEGILVGCTTRRGVHSAEVMRWKHTQHNTTWHGIQNGTRNCEDHKLDVTMLAYTNALVITYFKIILQVVCGGH